MSNSTEIKGGERPIIFSAPMVRATLDGSKIQTRRIMKVRHGGCGRTVHPAVQSIVHRGNGWWGFEASNKLKDQYVTTYPFDTIRCPYGVAGDRLWVRETWAKHPDIHATVPGACLYRADRGGDYQGASQGDFKWKPSIYMPRWASRITLEITGVRVERLQEISEEDATAEGCPASENEDICDRCDKVFGDSGQDANGYNCTCVHCGNNTYTTGSRTAEATEMYRQLWDSLHGKGAWELNPWVWVLEFKRHLTGNAPKSEGASFSPKAQDFPCT